MSKERELSVELAVQYCASHPDKSITVIAEEIYGLLSENEKAKATQGLTVGRMVHYYWGGQCRAAIITHVWDAEIGVVNLHVLQDGSDPTVPQTPTSILLAVSKTEGTWHWIERV